MLVYVQGSFSGQSMLQCGFFYFTAVLAAFSGLVQVELQVYACAVQKHLIVSQAESVNFSVLVGYIASSFT